MKKGMVLSWGLRLLSGWLLLGGILAVLVTLNPNRFTSVDSFYYLQSAENLLAGRGYVFEEDGQYSWNGIFPIGYSALIAAFSWLTSLPILACSKLINWIAVGFSGWRWTQRLGAFRAGWLLSMWFLGSFLRIAAYTWSETVFLVLLAEVIWTFHRLLKSPSTKRVLLNLGLALMLFLVRYIGGFIIGVFGIVALMLWLQPDKTHHWLGANPFRRLSIKLMAISIVGVAGVGFYFWLNSQFSDSPYGGERFSEAAAYGSLLPLFTKSLLNEALLIRDFIDNESNALAWIGVGIQISLLFFLKRRIKEIPPGSGNNSIRHLQNLFVLTGFLYLIILFGLRTLSPFAGPNSRLLAPFTFCFFFAALLWLTEPHRQKLQAVFRPFWIVLLVGSWLQLFPQVDLSRKLQQVQQKILFFYTK